MSCVTGQNLAFFKSVFFFGIFTVGSKEGAFVHAISSAGVVHSITRGCSTGDLSNCACDKKITPAGALHRDAKGNFSWTGCSDNVRYAVRFARKFVDVVEKHKRDDTGGGQRARDGGRALINLHNNRVGRKVRGLHRERDYYPLLSLG